MLNKEMSDSLNKQLNFEFFSSNLYLQMSAWCKYKALDGSAIFFKNQSEEEMVHMKKLFNYLSDTGIMPKLDLINAPIIKFSYFEEMIKYAYEHEQIITKKINNLAHIAISLKDYSTFQFLQWYVAEQHEEEKIFKSILDKFSLVRSNSIGLFFVDQYIKNIKKLS